MNREVRRDTVGKSSIPNRDVVLFVLGKLGGKTVKIDTETLAVECYRRYPSKFGLVKFPEYPGVEAVRRPLDEKSEECTAQENALLLELQIH